MRTFATLRVAPTGAPTEVSPGGIIGRGSGSSLLIRRGMVHEAHAVVSYRDGRLVLLPARGHIWINGERQRRVELRPSVRFDLDREGKVTVEVLGVVNYGYAFEVSLDGGGSTVLTPGCLYHIDAKAGEAWLRADGPATSGSLWMAGSEWYLEHPDGSTAPIALGEVHPLSGGGSLTIQKVELELSATLAGDFTLPPTPTGLRFAVAQVGGDLAVTVGGSPPLRGDAAAMLVLLLAQRMLHKRDLVEKADVWLRMKGKGVPLHSGRFSTLCSEVNVWLTMAAQDRRIDAGVSKAVRLLNMHPEDNMVGDIPRAWIPAGA